MACMLRRKSPPCHANKPSSLLTGSDPSANPDKRGLDGRAKHQHLRALTGLEARWRSGDAEDCKSLHPGSIPGRASSGPSQSGRPIGTM